MPAEPPPTDPGEVLRRRIRRTVEDAVGDGSVGQDPDPAAFVRVLRLERMLEAYQRTKPEPRRRLWPVVSLVSGIAVVLWLLLVLRVPSTDVSLALDLSSLTFRVGTETLGRSEHPESFRLIDAVEVDAVTLESPARITLDQRPIDATPVKPESGPARGIRIAAGAGSVRQALVNLDSGPAHQIHFHPLAVPAGTRVHVRGPEQGEGASLELEHPTQALELALTVPTAITVPPDQPLAAALDPSLATQEVVLRANPEIAQGRCARLAFNIRLAGTAGQDATERQEAREIVFAREIPVDVIRFTDIEDRARRRKQFSTVQGGTAFREELANREVQLRPGEFLDVRFAPHAGATGLPGWLDGIARALGTAQAGADAAGGGECGGEAEAGLAAQAPGTISRLSVGADGIDLQARGRVTHLSIGTLDSRRDLMPRRLERLQAGELLPLFWGAFLSVFGVCYTVFLYLRGSR